MANVDVTAVQVHAGLRLHDAIRHAEHTASTDYRHLTSLIKGDEPVCLTGFQGLVSNPVTYQRRNLGF